MTKIYINITVQIGDGTVLRHVEGEYDEGLEVGPTLIATTEDLLYALATGAAKEAECKRTER